MAKKTWAILRGFTTKRTKAEIKTAGLFDLERFVKEELNKVHVPFVDDCEDCPASDSNPVRGVDEENLEVLIDGEWTAYTPSGGGGGAGVTVIYNTTDFNNLAPTNGGLYLLIARGSTGSYINTIGLSGNADITEVLDVTNTAYTDPFRVGNGVLTGLFIAKQDYTYTGSFNPASTFKLKQLV